MADHRRAEQFNTWCAQRNFDNADVQSAVRYLCQRVAADGWGSTTLDSWLGALQRTLEENRTHSGMGSFDTTALRQEHRIKTLVRTVRGAAAEKDNLLNYDPLGFYSNDGLESYHQQLTGSQLTGSQQTGSPAVSNLALRGASAKRKPSDTDIP
eukprot:CAMPEP_0198692450 /NCGR_PEP_ID=MMETSP1468-20131203/227828_1 /TAXON_ID=1461545 /ORGANISM="Mantoniella sp, Strain CCMP1436" /LENGTH=153 /DNA_ID=CAMNT_0044446389 /DNA_START=213 /DNA_END=674 /DNA_ORIENTATION=+